MDVPEGDDSDLWDFWALLGDIGGMPLRRIGVAFVCLGVYVSAQSAVLLVTGFHADPSQAGIAWTAATAAVMQLGRREGSR